jgi:hypothetical protein
MEKSSRKLIMWNSPKDVSVAFTRIINDIYVDHKTLKDIFTKMVLSLRHHCWIEAIKVF